MKTRNIFELVAVLAMASLTLNSCKKDPFWSEDMQKKTADTIRGEYEIESLVWEGPEVDMDGDNLATKDLLKEWSALRLSGTQKGRISVPNPPVMMDDELVTNTIDIYIPFQKMFYLEEYDEYDYRGGTLQYKTTFIINRKGELLLDYNPFTKDEVLKFEDTKRNGDDFKIFQPEYAKLQVKIASYTVYDRLAQKFVSAPVTLLYKRVKYETENPYL